MPTKPVKPTSPNIRHSPMEHPRHQYPLATEVLQEIAKSCGLTEAIKWGKPCFTLQGKNIVLIQRFNEYIALMFFKGALLKDPEKLLSRIGEHMQVPRQLRFATAEEVIRLKPTIRNYIEEAIAVERSGAKIPLKKATDYKIPEELQVRLISDPSFKQAFAGPHPGPAGRVTSFRSPPRNNPPHALPG